MPLKKFLTKETAFFLATDISLNEQTPICYVCSWDDESGRNYFLSVSSADDWSDALEAIAVRGQLFEYE